MYDTCVNLELALLLKVYFVMEEGCFKESRVGNTQNVEWRSLWQAVWMENKKEVVSYLFSEIPDDFMAKEMYGVFEKYSKIVDAMIPVKCDKMGRRLGCSRFEDLVEPERIGIEL